jgi:NAD dependent epimerase/dehydratase family enzyme
MNPIKIILTGATGMVGEGVLMECLENPNVSEILSISRKPSGKNIQS